MQTKLEKITVLILIVALVYLSGCAAVKRKFTRKPKIKEKKVEDVVFVPEEYPGPAYDADARYKNYYILWKSWHDELLNVLAPDENRKRQVDCFSEVLANLEQMKLLLAADKQPVLQVLIDSIAGMQDAFIESGRRQFNLTAVRDKLNTSRRKIKLGFSYARVKEYLRQEAAYDF